MGRFAVVCALLAGPAMAQDWTPLTGDAIQKALSGKKFVYPANEVQEFFESGRTLYVTSRPSWGYWEVRGDQYCSQWPPSDLWACYDVAGSGDAIRFISEHNDIYDAKPFDE